jgi:hypothetical protein
MDKAQERLPTCSLFLYDYSLSLSYVLKVDFSYSIDCEKLGVVQVNFKGKSNFCMIRN